MLELGDNKIRKVENMETLTNLNELYLGKNKINKIENLEKLKNLKILSIQANRFKISFHIISGAYCFGFRAKYLIQRNPQISIQTSTLH